MRSFGDRVAEQLVSEGLLTQDQLDEVLTSQREQGGRLLKLLVDKQLVDDDDLMITVGRCQGTAPVNLDKFHVGQELIDMLPKDVELSFKISK